ncbi:hypothetical protein GLW20_01710 [Virgibacillus halodenitrificans]|nr:hypothetical protein [Virgibacillus halodenitrificans]
MFNHRMAIYQEYYHEVAESYKELRKEYINYKDKASIIYEENIGINEYNEKLSLHVDDIAINDNYQTFYSKYETDKDKAILSFIRNRAFFDENKINKLFKLRKTILHKKINDMTVDNIGTNLNQIREFYQDVYRDIERNKLEMKEGDIKFSDTKTITITHDGYKTSNFEIER